MPKSGHKVGEGGLSRSLGQVPSILHSSIAQPFLCWGRMRPETVTQMVRLMKGNLSRKPSAIILNFGALKLPPPLKD